MHAGATIEGVKNDGTSPESFPPITDHTQGGADGIIRVGTTYDDNSLVSARIDDQGNVTLCLYDNLNRCVAETKGLSTGTSEITKALILGTRDIVTPNAATIDDPAVVAAGKIDEQLARAQSRIGKLAALFPPLAQHVAPPTTNVYGLDPEGNLLIREDEVGNRLFIKYDAINRPIAVRGFRAGQTDSHHDDPIFAPAPIGGAIGPRHTIPEVGGTTKQDFHYDGLSRLVFAADNNDPLDKSTHSVATFAFDSLNRVIEERQQTGAQTPRVVSSGWRAVNLRGTLTFPNGRRIRHTYDGLDRIKTIVDDAETLALVEYNYIGPRLVLERLYPLNGIRATHVDSGGGLIGYDGVRRQVALHHLRHDNSLLIGYAHNYDRANNRVAQDTLHAAVDSELYKYDSSYRLARFERGRLNASKDAIAVPSKHGPEHEAWTLDGAGNWVNVDGEVREHSNFNALTSRNTNGTLVSLLHDANGNLIDDGAVTFTWDIYNRLRSATRKADAQTIATYAYDALGRRIRKNVSGSGSLDGTTFFYYDRQRVIEEHNAHESLMQQYMYGNYIDEVLVMDRALDADGPATGPGDRRFFYHQNGLMHCVALTDVTGAIVEGCLYDASGRQTMFRSGESGSIVFGEGDVVDVGGVSSKSNPYLFTGRRLDGETNLYYYRTRYFSPALGRFIGRDTIGCWGDVLGLGNGYAYLGNNPLNGVDPFGRKENDCREDDDECWERWCRQNSDRCEIIEVEGTAPDEVDLLGAGGSGGLLGRINAWLGRKGRVGQFLRKKLEWGDPDIVYKDDTTVVQSQKESIEEATKPESERPKTRHQDTARCKDTSLIA